MIGEDEWRSPGNFIAAASVINWQASTVNAPQRSDFKEKAARTTSACALVRIAFRYRRATNLTGFSRQQARLTTHGTDVSGYRLETAMNASRRCRAIAAYVQRALRREEPSCAGILFVNPYAYSVGDISGFLTMAYPRIYHLDSPAILIALYENFANLIGRVLRMGPGQALQLFDGINRSLTPKLPAPAKKKRGSEGAGRPARRSARSPPVPRSGDVARQ